MTLMHWVFWLVGGLVLGVALWYPWFLLLSRFDGWADLAQRYRFQGTTPPQAHRFVSGEVGGMFFSRGLALAVEPVGLYLTPLWFLRVGHPPLLIPWTAVQAVYRDTTPLVQQTRLMVQEHPDQEAIPITLPTPLLAPAFAWLPPVQDTKLTTVVVWQIYLLWIIVFGVAVLWNWFTLLRYF
jgi:hypothetical protein